MSAISTIDDERIVEFLDGELSSDDRRVFEDAMVADESLRRRVRELQSGWSMLGQIDDLQAAPTPDESVATTIQIVARDLQPDVDITPAVAIPRSRPRWRRAGWITAAVLSVAAVTIAARFAQSRQRWLDVPVAIDLPLLRLPVSDEMFAYLGENQDWRQWIDPPVSITPPTGDAAEIRRWTETLTPAQRTEVAAAMSRIRRIDRSETESLRQLERQIRNDVDARSLREAVVALVATVGADRLQKMEQSRGDARAAALGELVDDLRERWIVGSTVDLSPEAAERLRYAALQFGEQRIERMPAIRRLAGERSRGRPPELTIAQAIFRPPGERGGPPSRTPIGPSDEELSTLRRMLPARERESLQHVGGGDLVHDAILMAWTAESLRRGPDGSPTAWSATSALERYERMEESEREVVDLLPPDEAAEELVPSRSRSRQGFGPPP